MSRTYMHMPPRVKQRSRIWAGSFEPVHDHRRGPCDLDVFFAANGVEHRYGTTSCWMMLRDHRNIYCGCRNCTGRDGRILHTRRVRASLRNQLRAAVQTVAGGRGDDRDGLDDVDIRTDRYSRT